jgi:hypothetical protein
MLSGPFTTEQAVTLGVTRRVLQGRPHWRQVFRDVWVHDSLEDSVELRFQAVSLILPPYAVVCELTAAWLYGADVRRQDDLDIHISFPKGKRWRSRSGLDVSQETLSEDDVVTVRGVRVTTPTRTAFDCLRLLKGAEGIVVADAMTHLGLTSLQDLRIYFASQHRLRNLRVAEQLLDSVEPLSESPMETRVRVDLVSWGIPRPIAQHEVRMPDGVFVARLDLAWPELKVAVEYDGFQWHEKRREADALRRARLEALGWIVIVLTAEDYELRRAEIAATVWAAIRERRRVLGDAS